MNQFSVFFQEEEPGVAVNILLSSFPWLQIVKVNFGFEFTFSFFVVDFEFYFVEFLALTPEGVILHFRFFLFALYEVARLVNLIIRW